MALAGRLCFETGASFEGLLFGAPLDGRHAWGEVVFNTCMTGYQEVMTDPSYAGQIVVMTYPMIGNYGCRASYMESDRIHCRAFVVRDLSDVAGHPLAERTLDAELRHHGVPGLTDVDTRSITRQIRSTGSVRAVLASSEVISEAAQVELCRQLPGLSEQDLVAQVSQRDLWNRWVQPLPSELASREEGLDGTQRCKGRLRVVCLDLGIKRNQLRALASRGVEVITVRHNASLQEILDRRPDGIVISNGPGDPAQLEQQANLARGVLERAIPLLGICLGHQVIARAIGATTSRLPFGHHGANHSVREERTGRVWITAQNHEFQVDEASVPLSTGWYVSERNLNDGSVEGLRHATLPALTVQYHPEGAPGPQDRSSVFDEFLVLCRRSAGRLPGRAEESMPSVEGNGRPAASSTEVRLLPPSTRSGSHAPRSVLMLGSGPIVIGQAAEFDYAGTQACRALREEGVRVVLVNSNPATIMTDDASADAVYIEPLTPQVLERVISRERPEGLLATLGGQTGLNLAVSLDELGILDRYGVRVLSTSLDAIRTAEDRERFKTLLRSIGEPVPESRSVSSLIEAREFADVTGLPLVVRPAFTLGGTGGGLCETLERFLEVVASGLAASPINQVLVERSLAGWREIEYEVVRDGAGTAVTICNMENVDPMGVHTGDSIVVAPSQTLTDREHQQLRTAALRIIESLRIEGGCNVQFALAPASHEYFVIEVNPRVSRSSALASKATGYPIARVAAKVALGRRLEEIPNSITGKTTAAFEPALDYCVVKIPRWPFDKFGAADRRLGTQMKSTGEAMAIERTFEAAVMKAHRSLEKPAEDASASDAPVLVRVANDRRLEALTAGLRRGESPEAMAEESDIGAWFLHRLQRVVRAEEHLQINGLQPEVVRRAKRCGLADEAIDRILSLPPNTTWTYRSRANIRPTYKSVDTCAAEFEAVTPYYYSCFESESETPEADGSVVVLGSGPIRIGQGIEFDYCSVQAAGALRKSGHSAVMINSNPETVSTDFDCSTRLYFEPLDVEAVSSVLEVESGQHPDSVSGALVQFGGQTAINLAAALEGRGYTILGTSIESIELAEDRDLFDRLMAELGVWRPGGKATSSLEEAIDIADGIGYPVLVRPSFVLGGRGMEIVYDAPQLESYMTGALAALPREAGAARGSVLVDKYLLGREVDVDVVADGETVLIPGLMEHVERAGVHSGDSMAVYPALHLDDAVRRRIVDQTTLIARRLGVKGLCNLQFVVSDDRSHVIEVNPRSSRTVPFISKVTGVPMVELATRVSCGESLKSLGWTSGLEAPRPVVAIKAPVFSMSKLQPMDMALGPEMKSTGEVMGADTRLDAAIEKAFLAALGGVPTGGGALCSIADADKQEALPILRRLKEIGFLLYATSGTASLLAAQGIEALVVGRINQSRPSVLDVIDDGLVSLVVNTVSRASGATAAKPDTGSLRDGFLIRTAAERHRIPCCTSLDTASALADVIARHSREESFHVAPLKEYREGLVRPEAAASRTE